MKRNGHYGNGNKGNRFGGGGGGGGGRYRKGGGGGGGNGGGGNHAQFAENTGDTDFVHPRQRRHLQAQKDRYVALARDALGKGDRILAEFYYQHVEHYSRMIGLIPEQQPQQQRRQRGGDQANAAEGAEQAESDADAADADAEGDDADEGDDTPAPTGFGGGPSSFYAQPAAPANASVAPPEDEADAANY